MSFEPGRLVIRRYLRGEYVTWAQAARVVRDDEDELLLWVPLGSGFACRESRDGERLREVPLAAYGESALVVDKWRHTSVLIRIRPGASHSLWWVFADGQFAGWYVNLEQPARRWVAGDLAGVDTIDHGLDVVATPDRRWRWKDEEDFRDYTGEPGYWTADEAEQICAEADTVIATLERGEFPFDGSWCDFRPDPGWLPDPLPERGWQEALPGRGTGH